MSKIKVFIIDDSVIVRTLFTKLINSKKDMEVVGFATDPIVAQQKLKILDVDVIILDIELPKMNGLDYLEQIMLTAPKPVIVCSGSTDDRNSKIAKEALLLGAVDVIGKIDKNMKDFMSSSSNKLITAIRKVRISGFQTKKPKAKKASSIIGIGSSTGGIKVIETILNALPKHTPPILIVQHITTEFTAPMVQRFNATCKIKVKEAINGEYIKHSTAYFSPSDIHMSIQKDKNGFRILLIDGEKVNQHKPSIDILFKSLAKEIAFGQDITAFILTGMGNDGAVGIKAIKDKGGSTYAQNKASCTVYGMPNEAIKLNAIDEILSPNEMAKYII